VVSSIQTHGYQCRLLYNLTMFDKKRMTSLAAGRQFYRNYGAALVASLLPQHFAVTLLFHLSSARLLLFVIPTEKIGNAFTSDCVKFTNEAIGARRIETVDVVWSTNAMSSKLHYLARISVVDSA